jgi:hypothetical protein
VPEFEIRKLPIKVTVKRFTAQTDPSDHEAAVALLRRKVREYQLGDVSQYDLVAVGSRHGPFTA